jgi:hypothetical protein
LDIPDKTALRVHPNPERQGPIQQTYRMSRSLPKLSASRSKGEFFQHLQLDDSNEAHRQLYREMMVGSALHLVVMVVTLTMSLKERGCPRAAADVRGSVKLDCTCPVKPQSFTTIFFKHDYRDGEVPRGHQYLASGVPPNQTGLRPRLVPGRSQCGQLDHPLVSLVSAYTSCPGSSLLLLQY